MELILPPLQGYKLLDIEDIRWRAVALRKKVHEQEWIPAFDKAKEVKRWWGYHPEEKEDCRVLFTYSKDPGGLGYNHIEHLSKEYIEILPMEELPLLINDNLDEAARAALKSRLSNNLPLAPHNQALTDRYFKAEHRSSRLNRVIGKCNELIERYITTKCYEKYPHEMKWALTLLVNLKINGREYIAIRTTQNKTTLFYPEELPLKEIQEQEILIDEKKQPLIHGVNHRAPSPINPCTHLPPPRSGDR